VIKKSYEKMCSSLKIFKKLCSSHETFKNGAVHQRILRRRGGEKEKRSTEVPLVILLKFSDLTKV
jgi:hypothetical protein